jgi:hypothetical protein
MINEILYLASIPPGPFPLLLLFSKVTETVPFKFPGADWTAKLNLAVTDAYNLPVACPGPSVNMNFLAHRHRIGPENYYTVFSHILKLLNPAMSFSMVYILSIK